MRKLFKTTGKLLLILLAVLLVAGVAFAQLSPQLGGTPKQDYTASGHYKDGEFFNPIATSVMTGGSQFAALRHMLFDKTPGKKPPGPLPMQFLDSLTITQKGPDLVRVTWFGHSASLVEIAGQNILLDPMLSIKMGPIGGVAPTRYNPRVPIAAERLPAIDAVLISHDHYDHLDYQTVLKIKDKTKHFYVPLGAGAHLLRWGVPATKITEVSWGDSVQLPGGLTIVSTPTRHFSGRGLTNRNSTFWTSWVLKTPTKRLFYSGDGGYGPHFQQIGAQYGPFDLALMECGQYDAQWAEIHMRPEQSVQAALDLRARVMQPVHWAAFTEANHSWNDPVKRAWAKAARRQLPLTTPELGQPVVLDGRPLPQQQWWQ